ncbi:TOMM precursor leader peptide-binding protein [Spirillospora sp. NPDC048911]|uniref:TOMM precursor leader peptide-binding protein n=1 Tax=Spirillospora sp. NPDC048911 TaxID=3364527 RepID=UPI0037123467
MNDEPIGFKRHVAPAIVPGEAVYLLSAQGTIALSGAKIQSLAPLLDGRHSLDEVRERTRLSDAEVDATLSKLAEANLVGYRKPSSEPPADAYWDLAGAETAEAPAGRVRLIELGDEESDEDEHRAEAAGALRDLGLEPDDGAEFALVLCDDYLDPRLEDLNRRRLADGVPWLLAKPSGPELWIGPVFRPGEGPCWSCLATRLSAHRRGEMWLRSKVDTSLRPPEASLPTTRALGVNLAVLETAKWIADVRTPQQDAVWTLETLSMEAERHQVSHRPQCAACGDSEVIAEQVCEPVVIRSRAKKATGGNGHRALSPELVWHEYEHLADPVTGVTEPIRRDPRCPPFLHCYLAGPNLALTHDDLTAMRTGLRRQSGGKGHTELEARVGALCEAVERYCGSRHGDEPAVRASLRDLGPAAVHPDSCQLFDPRQYADRDRWNAAGMNFQYVPEPFDDQEVLDWTPVWSLTHGNRRLLPTDLLYFGRSGHPSVLANSNGNAAGSSLEDAIVQGFLELVERDAVALWWYNRTRHPSADPALLADPWIAGLRARYRKLDREFWVLDVSSDLGIPVMAAISRRTDKPAEDIMLGFGAHFDPEVAVRRALTELGQLLPNVSAARADGSGYGEADAHTRNWWLTATAATHPYLVPDARQSPRPHYYVPRNDLKDDVEHIVALARGAGLEVLVLDQTRPDIGMPVAKVIVPGLRHFWARFAPGRLYDVPVALGRLERPTAYADLNPTPLFL